MADLFRTKLMYVIVIIIYLLHIVERKMRKNYYRANSSINNKSTIELHLIQRNEDKN